MVQPEEEVVLRVTGPGTGVRIQVRIMGVELLREIRTGMIQMEGSVTVQNLKPFPGTRIRLKDSKLIILEIWIL